MSFSDDIRHELCSCDISASTKNAFIYGLLYGFGRDNTLATASRDTASCIMNVLPGQAFEFTHGKKYIFTVKSDEMLGKYHPDSEEIDRSIVSGNDLVTGAFLRGLFIVSGNVYIQKAGYHLEISVPDSGKCGKLHELINEQGMNVRISQRRGHPFIYSKNSENISDFLTYIGAMKSAMEVMNIKIIKEVRSGINRTVNCETANIEKTASAAAKQILDIKLIAEKTGLEVLPDELRALASLRLENPDMSLSSLGKQLDPVISRSGVNHRLERIAKIADELREERQ